MAKKRSSSVINVLIAGDTKKFKKALGSASSSLADFSKKVGQVGVAAGVALAGIGAKSVGLAVDFEESLSKAQQIFGNAAKGIEDSAKGAAEAVGLSQSEFLEAAANMGVFGKAAGLSGSDLSGFADEMVTVAADVASFNNLRPEEALEKLQAGLRGSNEPLQSIGVLINAAAVNAKALELGLGDANGEISEGNKIMARQALIMEKLGEQGALGDFARTSEGLANQTRIMKARFKDLGIELGKKLIPIATKLSKGVGKLIGFGEKISKIYGQKGFAGVIETLTDGFIRFRGKIFDVLQKILPQIGKKLIKIAPVIFKAVKTIAKDSAKRLLTLGRAFIDWITPLIPGILQKLKQWGQTIGDFILHTALPFIGEKIGIFAAAFLDWIGPLAKKLLVNLPTIVKTIVKWLAETGIPAIVKAGGKLAEHLVPALLRFGGEVLEGIKSILIEVGGEIGRGFVNLGGYATDQASKFGNKILDAIMKPINFVGGLVTAALSVVVGTFKSVYNALVEAWNSTVGGFGFTIPDWVKYTGIGAPFAGKGFHIPTLTPLAEGGIVTNPTAALIGEAGPEAVIPLNKMGAMGTTNITINMPAGADGQDIVSALQNYVRTNGSVALSTTGLVQV